MVGAATENERRPIVERRCAGTCKDIVVYERYSCCYVSGDVSAPLQDTLYNECVRLNVPSDMKQVTLASAVHHSTEEKHTKYIQLNET